MAILKKKLKFKKIVIKKNINRTYYIWDIIGFSFIILIATFNPYKWVSILGWILALIILVNKTLKESNEEIYKEV